MTSIEDFTSQYGLVQKIDAFGYLDYLKKNPDAPRKHGKVVLVTADTPLTASRGEGKTTTTIALIDALRERGIDAAAVLRQPSMGITAAGSKGGASGGGKASLTHPELIDWGLCGEMGAIEAAQNLLVSFAEKAVDDGKLDTILVPRVSEVPSRSLRQIAVDRGKGDVAERVVLTPTCELMQIVVLSRSMDEISERVAKMVAGTKDGNHDFQIPGALLRGRGRAGTFLCGDQGIVCRKPAHQGKDGIGRSGRQAEGSESRPPEPEIPPARQAADQIPG